MKPSTLLVVALFFVAIGSSAAADTDAIQKEMAKFNGTWGFVSVEMEGTKLPEDHVKEIGKLVIKDGKFTVKQGDTIHRGTFKVVLSKKPKQLDVTLTEGPEKGQTILGIYELEGDTYKLGIGSAGKERPTEFVSKPGSGHRLEVLKREKP